MTGKKTMFGMGNQFNGFADEKYLKGLENRTHEALSQGNVKLSKTFTEVLPKASGALPDVIDANMAMADTQKALGAIVQTLYVSLAVDKKSKSVVQGYNVVGSGAYSGAYLQGYTNTLFYANSGTVNFNCWYLNRDGTWSYYKTNIPVKNDWVQVDGEWYFFNGAGIMWVGWLDWNGYKYYMRSCKEWNEELKIHIENGGQMTVGWKKIADRWYYFKSHIVNGEQKGGQMVTGWRQIPESDNKYFYFYSDGEMAENVLIEYKGDYYFLKDNGYMAENEEITDPKTNKKYKANETGVCEEINDSIMGQGSYSQEDYNYLVALGTECPTYDGFLAVAYSVITRADERNQSIREVVTAKNQYSGFRASEIGNPKNEAVKQAAIDALTGAVPNPVGKSTFFFGRVNNYDLWYESTKCHYINEVDGNIFYVSEDYGYVHNKSSTKTSDAVVIYSSSQSKWLKNGLILSK